MENYKLVNSRAVQEKAERLGYKYSCPEDSVGCNIERFVFTQDIGYLRVISDLDTYNESRCKEITQADFLALPEPIKVDDWVKHSYESTTIIVKICFINNKNSCRAYGITFDLYFEDCTKLTPEQIKILGLQND